MAGGNRRRQGPSDPAAIAARAALRRGLEAARAREAAKDPARWGVSAEILRLPTAADVNAVVGNRNRIVAANRSDPFDLLHEAKSVDKDGAERRGLTDDQHRAARRLFRAWCFRAGVRDRDRMGLDPGMPRVDGGRHDPSAMVTDAMIDAGRMIAFCLKGVGPVLAKVLELLISPMVDEGRIIHWRAQVQRATGETERHAQGAMVRQACESLRLVLEAWDEEVRRGRARAAA